MDLAIGSEGGEKGTPGRGEAMTCIKQSWDGNGKSVNLEHPIPFYR